MKSVKNFIERISSIDHSDNSSTGTGGGGGGTSSLRNSFKKHSHKFEKLKVNAAGTTAGNTTDSNTDGNASSPSVISNTGGNGGPAAGEPSPTSSTIQTPTFAVPESSLSTTSDGGSNSASATASVSQSISGGNMAQSPSSNTGHDINDGNATSPTTNPFDFNKPTPHHHATTSVSSSLSAPVIKPQKSRRKISLPWFRQSSVTSHASLSRQHTIDSPASFRLFRQPSNNFKVGTLEATWVVSDYIATAGSNELSVTKGQQVEIVEAPTNTEPDFCLVRLNPQNDDAAVQEGLVPISILKPPPGTQKLSGGVGSSTSASRKEVNETIQEQSNNRGKSDALTSSTKRRGFSGRKWLPPPLRKLSQSKVEKPIEKSLIKKSSEKNLRLQPKHAEHGEENITANVLHQHTTNYTSNTGQHAAATAQQNLTQQQQQDYEADEEVGLELPPPMKPIQEPHLMVANGPPTFKKDLKENSTNMASTGKMDGNTAIDLSDIEQLVKEKTEQHEEKSKFLKPNFDANNISSSDNNGRNSDLQCYNDTVTDNNDENNTEANDVEAAQRKRACAFAELLSTEELYIQDLSEIVNGYIAEICNPNSEIPKPDDLKGGKDLMVFGNIQDIYEWHRDYFLKALQRCQKTPAELGTIIKRYELKLDNKYNLYCQNKHISEHIVTEHYMYFEQIRQKLKHRLDLSDLLIKPIQRITKYELLFREIAKQTERSGLVDEFASMEEAYRVMKDVCKAVNDTMVLRRLQKYEGKISAQGKLLLHGPLICIEDAKSMERNACMVTKPRELQVFLFQQSIFFSDIVGKKTQFTSPSYIYRSHIMLNKMQLEEQPNNRFLIKSTDPNRTDLNMICYAGTVELTRKWLETIRKILQLQHDFLTALTRPIEHQNALTKQT